MMLQGICDAKGTTLLFASKCGKSILGVAQVEKNRVVEKANVDCLYHENIVNLAKELDGNTKRLHYELKLLGTEVIGRVIAAGRSANGAIGLISTANEDTKPESKADRE